MQKESLPKSELGAKMAGRVYSEPIFLAVLLDPKQTTVVVVVV